MSYEEFPFYFACGDDRLCGVICSPTTEIQDVGVVLLTGGNYTRSHRNRMWVRTARRLAEHGFASIRFDYHGVGDSEGEGVEMALERPFTEDVMAAGAALQRATGVSQLFLGATCFGGRNAVPAGARMENIVGMTLFPMPVVVAPPEGSRTVRSRANTAVRSITIGARVLRHPMVRRLRKATASSRGGRPVSPQLKQDLSRFLEHGRLHLVYGELADSLSDMRRCIQEVCAKNAGARARIDLEIVEGTALQGFQKISDQDVVVDRIVATVRATADDVLGANA